jgi:hypothetical protein
MTDSLRGSVVYVVRWRADGDITFHGPLSRRLEDAGARLAIRTSREVTHVVFVQKALASPHERSLEEEKLREIYGKIEKVRRGIATQHARGYIVNCSQLPLTACTEAHSSRCMHAPSSPTVFLSRRLVRVAHASSSPLFGSRRRSR